MRTYELRVRCSDDGPPVIVSLRREQPLEFIPACDIIVLARLLEAHRRWAGLLEPEWLELPAK